MIEKLLKRMGALKEIRVGKVDKELADKLTANKNAHDEQHEAIAAKLKAYAEELHKEHQPQCDKFNEEREQLWEQIYDQLGLTEEERGHDYSIDRRTGVVTRAELKNPFGSDDEDAPVGPLQ